MKYLVTYKRLYTCTVEVEAKNAEEAEKIAIDEWLPKPSYIKYYNPNDTWVSNVSPIEDSVTYNGE